MFKTKILNFGIKGKGNEDDDDSDSEMFHHTGNFLTKSQYLPKNVLDIKKCTDANKDAPHTVSFKP